MLQSISVLFRLPFYRPPSEGWGKVIVSVCSHFGGGYPIQPRMEGVPDPALDGGGPMSQIFKGRGSQVSDFWGEGEGYPVSVKGKIFDTRFGLIHVQTGNNFFVVGPPLVKGKFFDTRFGLIHVQTGKKIFVEGPPTPPQVRGKIFDTRFGLIHVQTGKNFLLRDPPPSKGKNF